MLLLLLLLLCQLLLRIDGVGGGVAADDLIVDCVQAGRVWLGKKEKE